MRAYVGEADSVKSRIAQSAGERGFWETAVVVTTSDDALSKGHVRYLEARLIEDARSAGRVVLDNAQEPAPAKRRLPEADKANMEAFLANLKTVLPVVGVDLLKPRPVITVPEPDAEPVFPDSTVVFEIRHRSGVTAEAIEQDDEFFVLAGSQTLRDTGYSQTSYGKLKEELIADGVLVDSGTGRYRFARPYPFRSPSAAAAVILDRNSNGRHEWKLQGSQQSYHDWQQAQSLLASVSDL